MCLLFLYINNDAAEDGYRLIAANTRDEFFDRPALPANYWKNLPYCYGGIDYQPGREAGTWLSMSTKGRIGCLLNVLSRQDPIKAGRGHLVSDYLKSELNSDDYIEDIAMESIRYNLFNFVSLENKGDHWNGHLYTNANGGSKMNFSDGVYQFGNSVNYEEPWRKGTYGKKMFNEIVNSLSDTKEADLHAKLMELLSDDTKKYPDTVLDSQSHHMPCGAAKQLSSIAVKCPLIRYGTRTKTVITINGKGKCCYEEKTMQEPIPDEEFIKWNRTMEQFTVESY